MEQSMRQRDEQNEMIDLMEFLVVIKTKIVWVIIAALCAGVFAYAYTAYFITPMYQASIQVIVNTKKDAYTTINVNDVTNAETLVNTYATVIKSNRVLDKVIAILNLDMEWTELNNMVTVTPVDDTPVMNIMVKCENPLQAREIVTTISEVAPELIVDAVEAGSCKVISDAYTSGSPIYPNVKGNTMKGMLLGAVGAIGIIVLKHLLNDLVESEEQLADVTGVPVLGTIPLEDEERRSNKKRRKK